MDAETALLTNFQFDELEEEIIAMRKRITCLQMKVGLISEKLDPAAFPMEDRLDGKHIDPAQKEYDQLLNARLVMLKAALPLIKSSPLPLTKSEIEQRLLEMGIEKNRADSHYLRTLLQKLSKKGLITKHGERYGSAA